jgi:membrane protein DedA with SNARE-associated domain
VSPPHTDDETPPVTITPRDGTVPGPQRIERRLIIVGGIVILSYIGGLIGLALLPLLASEQPLLLLLIYPVSGALFLIAPKFDPVAFVTIATVRRVVVHVLFYLLGRWYGDRALAWVVQRSGSDASGMASLVERFFGRFGWAIVTIFPGPLPSVLAGSTRLRWPLFLALDLLGTIVSVAIVRAAATAASGPLATVLRFIDQNSRWLTIITVVATVAWVLMQQMRQGKQVEEEETEPQVEA